MARTITVEYENPCCCVRWLEPDRVLYEEWNGMVKGENYRTAQNAAIDIFQRHKGSKVLFDTRGVKVLPREDQEWHVNVAIPRLIAAGMRYSAIVNPEAAVGELSVSRAVSSATASGAQRQAATFTDVEEALSWLASNK